MDLSETISKNDALLLLDIIGECVTCKNKTDADKLVVNLKKVVDVENAVYALAKLDNKGLLVSYDTLSLSYPQEWLDLYAAKGFYKIDPICRENFSNFKLQFWGDTYKERHCPKEFIMAAKDFNLDSGFACGVRNSQGTEGSILSLAGRLSDNPRNRFILGTLTHHLHQAFSSALSFSKKKTYFCLSKREKEVLNWIKVGKSSWEISAILTISECTVKFHVCDIMVKLDAVSRTHAVAIALAEGLIDID
jgi:DNA-binding CsgD family transcriptional regulator